jgi:hypothetical protein
MRATFRTAILLLPLILTGCEGGRVTEPGGEPDRTGTATLEWTTPTYRTDGSELDDLAGFRVYFGPEPGNYPHTVNIPDPDATSYRMEGLPPGTWYFVVVAYDSAGNEGAPSAPASKTVQ